MPVRLEGTDFMVLLAGVLDDDPGSKPFRHIHVGQAAAWDHIHDSLTQFEARAPADQQIRPSKPTP
jgi:hypothetical protein